MGPLHADANSRIVQIHIIPGHYVVSCQDEGQITIYDSVPYVERSVQLLPQLKVRYSLLDNHPDPISLVKYIIPQIQSGSSDCGLFAAANAYLLLSGTNPQNVILQQSELRSHLHRCLKLKSVTPFPTSATNMTDSAINRYFSESISLQQQKLSSSVNTDKLSNRSRSSYFREWRAKRDAKQVLKDKQIDLKRKSESRIKRTVDNIVKDRQSDQKHRSEKRSSRTSDQIVKDRRKDQNRKSDSRTNRTSDQIVKDRQRDQKRKSDCRASRTSDHIFKDRQSDQ